jgi:hypothetical protein
MNFFKDGFTAVPIRWYFADAGAKFLPGPTLFASSRWASLKSGPWFGPGEVLGAPKTFDYGVNSSQKKGLKFCGQLSWYADGISVKDGIVPDPDCCPTIPNVVVVSSSVQATGSSVAKSTPS